MGDVAAAAGLARVHLIAWRDLDDVEAGGSEVHAATVARLWAEAGIDVQLRTSYAQGHPPVVVRDGYKVVRRAGRYMVFPRAALFELSRRRSGPRDGLVEIWNGMPFFSPLWARGPRIVFLHHVHAEMWQMVLPPNLAHFGDTLERRIAPPLYRRSRIVTLSRSSRDELVELGYRSDRVSVVPPGIDPGYSPGGERSEHPLVVACGRLVPVKRYDVLIDSLAEVRRHHPTLQAVITSEGYERLALEERIRGHGAEEWLTLVGHVSEAAKIDLYRRAWLVASASAREGWGMTLTEAAACGTPAVATRIAGHLDAVADGTGGLLVRPGELAGAIGRVLADPDLRRRLNKGALAHSRRFTWGQTALGTLQALADDAHRRRRRR